MLVYKYNELPEYKLQENRKNAKLCNYYSTSFKSRFGTVTKPITVYSNIDDNDYKNELEKKTIISYISNFNTNGKLKTEIKTFDQLYKYRQHVYDYQVNRYNNNDISGITLSKYLYILGVLILYYNPFKLSIRILSNSIIQHSNDIQKKQQQEKYDNNVMTDKYVSMTDLIKQREELKANLNLDIPQNEYNKTIHNNHMKYIKLCMNTYLPPLRLELLYMKYKVCNVAPTTDKKDKTNYLCLYDNIYYIVINHDKVVKRYGQQIFKLDVNNEYMKCDIITYTLNKSFLLFPRDYVFTSYKDTTKPMNKVSYTNILTCGQNILRQSYHTYYEKEYKPSLTNEQLKDIAQYMRHSLSTARSIYIKVKNNNGTEQKTNKTNKTSDIKTYRKDYMKSYTAKGTYGEIRTKDNRYLNYLRSGKIKKPKQINLDKHGIHLVDGIYTFTDNKLLERSNNKKQ